MLTSFLTAYHQGEWTVSEVQSTLQMLFDRQYALTQTVVVEVRYRPETRYDSDGDPYTVQVPYNYYICNVTLDNADLSHLPVEFLDEDKLHQYATYMATYGNRPDLFPTGEYPNASQREDYLDYDVPPEALEDGTFAAMLAEAEKYLGFPYVWGRASAGGRQAASRPSRRRDPGKTPTLLLTAPALSPGSSITAAEMWGHGA